MSAPSRAAQELLDKLVEIARLIEAHNATLFMLERERMQLQTQLAQSGYRPAPQAELL